MDVRCPGTRKGSQDPCDRLTAVTSEDFVGTFSTRCRRCDQDFALGRPSQIRLTCSCGKWLASGKIDAGYVQMVCPREKTLVRLTPHGTLHLEPPPRQSGVRPMPPLPRQRTTAADLVKLMEERWELLRYDRAKRSSEVAVGVRFDVLNRDGFQCRYCGRGLSQGVFLEVDHVVPRAAGGLDELTNLVTACWDCNRGKSAKRINPLDTAYPAA